jgi:glycosyltransferase involved in cell wall biosynthesis
MDDIAPKIALVVCTRNRARRLGAFFESIKRLNCSSLWDFVLVDNGSTDDTSACLESFVATFRGRATLVNEPQAGLGRARNRGWRASNAPIIAFTDDDCYPDPNFLNDLEVVFADPALGFAGGRILLHDPSDARITICESESVERFDPGDFIFAGVIQGANMAFRRQALVDIDGFDDNLGAGREFAFEDVDAQLRTLAAGWKGKYDPRPVVYHHHGRKPGIDQESLIRVYEAGRGAYFMKCILFMPQRWRCLRTWLRLMKQQPFGQTVREAKAALRYFAHQFNQKPNVTY